MPTPLDDDGPAARAAEPADGARPLLGAPTDFVSAIRPEHPLYLPGRYVTLRPIGPATDARALYALSHLPDGDPSIWTYLYDGPYASEAAYEAALTEYAVSTDPLYMAVVPAGDGAPHGMLSYLAIVPEHGTIEIGNIWFGAGLRRTAAATEAIYLLARHAFEALGYRRLEWKCNALNAPSRQAAARLGFSFEGIFVQHRVVKGRNRDTAWFAVTDGRWRSYLRAAYQTWLDPGNFTPDGTQRRSLSELTAQEREPALSRVSLSPAGETESSGSDPRGGRSSGGAGR